MLTRDGLNDGLLRDFKQLMRDIFGLPMVVDQVKREHVVMVRFVTPTSQ